MLLLLLLLLLLELITKIDAPIVICRNWHGIHLECMLHTKIWSKIRDTTKLTEI